MSRRSRSKKLTAARTQELDVAAAIAREAVVQLHADHALALVRQAAGRVAPARMLDIYLRLLGLDGAIADVIATRVLASLGQPRPDIAGEPDPHDEASAGDVATDDDSMLRTLRRRLRGRVNDDLRRAVELQTGAAQAALLDLHVRHAHGFARLLHETHGTAEACAVYTDMVHVPRTLAAVLYILVLDRIAAAEHTRAWAAAPDGAAPPHRQLGSGAPAGAVTGLGAGRAARNRTRRPA